jgi:hypothetical protein
MTLHGILILFLSCCSLRFTNIAVAAYPYSSGDNRMKKVSFCCVHLGRVWPGCSDASLLDTLVFDIDPPTSQDDEYGVNIEDAAALAGDMGMMEGNETERLLDVVLLCIMLGSYCCVFSIKVPCQLHGISLLYISIKFPC